MTEEQRIKLEEYLDEFEVAVTVRTLCDHPNALEVAVKATDDHRERILDHLDTIQAECPMSINADLRTEEAKSIVMNQIHRWYSFSVVINGTHIKEFEKKLDNLITIALEQSAQ